MNPRMISMQSISRSNAWLRLHAAEYPGQWVAVRDGVLLGVALTVRALYDHIGPPGEDSERIVVKVLRPTGVHWGTNFL